MDRYLAKYLKEACALNPLDQEAERALIMRSKSGDREARDELCMRNMRLVVSVATQHKSRDAGLDDLVQEGTVGLLEGIDRFDLAYETRLSTYVQWWIFMRVATAVMKARQSRRPRKGMSVRSLDRMQVPDVLLRISDLAEKPDMETLLGIYPSWDEDAIHDEQDKSEECDRLELAMDMLPARDRIMVIARYGLDGGGQRTFKQVAELFGIPVGRAEQVLLSSLQELWRRLRTKGGLEP